MLSSRLRPLHTLPPDLSTEKPRDADDNDNNDDASADAEDLFTAFLPHLFPNDAPQFHGDPGQYLLYTSPRYGNLTIQVPSYPEQSGNASSATQDPGSEAPAFPIESDSSQLEKRRTLFAHILWSSGLVVAEAVENAHAAHEHVDPMWKMEGEKVLELGAGAALPSIVSALAGASEVTITDHPSSPALSGTIVWNMKRNIPATNACAVSIQPHEWGVLSSNSWAVANKGHFTRIIAADCLWMRSQHENLVRTMKWFLAPEGRVWVVAGFHTGRAILVEFLKVVSEMGLAVEVIYERDQNTSYAEGGHEVRRDWVEVRDGEGPENRMRWCVVARLKHAS
ncbi:putative nicotinamide N-methyltransferase [Aspergillus saccharolyticus JOP 1030-1]|uniref:Nicotinamide N-methyltransferase n=1 Tax=Aspergillus saccharolyticus JOP 1030-1 TaxID=1450539 RepID=A0A318ZJI0_9EURO|nr:hypothetical protein BP01DRAFT_424500 [Aspergillus saccharolyticus JOP 1030-1]PYH43910.1 hypothetical protein BP01DRAFT_424500 [Aspergillus saccharolyticus JOP 1030-1]